MPESNRFSDYDYDNDNDNDNDNDCILRFFPSTGGQTHSILPKQERSASSHAGASCWSGQ